MVKRPRRALRSPALLFTTGMVFWYTWLSKRIPQKMIEEMSSQNTDEPVAPERKVSRAAEWCLILGIVSNFCLWVAASIPAIILGTIALRNIKGNPSTLTGRRRAIAGITLACTGLIVSPFLFVGSGVFHTCRGSDRVKCILQLQTMEKLMISYGNLNDIKSGDEIDPSVLIDDEYISALPVCPKGGVYTYSGKMPSGESGTKPYVKCDVEGHDFEHWPSEAKQTDER